MIFTKHFIAPIPSYEGLVSPEFLIIGLKNARIEKGESCWFFIQDFSEKEIQIFKEYWNLIKPLLDFSKIEVANYQLRWDGHSGSELFEFLLDSSTGHRITFGFYPIMKEYDVYYYEDRNQFPHTTFLMGKTKNIISSLKLKEVLGIFYK